MHLLRLPLQIEPFDYFLHLFGLISDGNHDHRLRAK